MFSSYHNVRVLPIRNFRQWGKKQTAVGLYPTYGGIYPILWGKKRMRFLAIYS